MGSKPSKAKKIQGASSDPPTQTAVVSTTITSTAQPAGSIDDIKPFCDRARADMRALQKSEVYDDEAAVDHLNDILKIWHERCSRDNEAAAKICDILIGHNILNIFVKLWDRCHENAEVFYSDVATIHFKNLNRLKVILWNFTDKCRSLALEFYKDETVIERIMREFSMPQLDVPKLHQPRLRHMIKANFGILHNILRHYNKNKDHIRKDDGIDKIRALEKSTYLIIKAKVFIVLAYCINEDENSKIIAGSGVIAFILTILESAVASPSHVAKNYAFSAEETVAALNKLASSDENKKSIVEAGVLPLLTKLLDVETSSSSEHLESVNCLWSLAFHKDNKERIIEESDLIDGVKKLRTVKGISDRLTKAIESLMFVLDLEQPIESHVKGGEMHIMLSYNWEVQHVMLKLRDFLQSQGINIWMDVDKIHDSILSAMADAVENSALVMVAMTESYKNSNSCRTEAEYAYHRQVPILPLLLQPGYKADGWLGAMIGTKLYVNLSSEEYESKFPDVLNEIRTKVGEFMKSADGGTALVKNHAPPVRAVSIEPVKKMANVPETDGDGMALVRAKLPCHSWSVSEVASWCAKVGIQGLDGCDGTVLSQLCKTLLRSPETYYQILREDLRLNFKDMLSVTNSVESLLR